MSLMDEKQLRQWQVQAEESKDGLERKQENEGQSM